MFRALICPSSGARDCAIDYHIGRFVLGLLYGGGGWSSVRAGHYSSELLMMGILMLETC